MPTPLYVVPPSGVTKRDPIRERAHGLIDALNRRDLLFAVEWLDRTLAARRIAVDPRLGEICAVQSGRKRRR